jgi:hypothetical protein
VELPKSKELFEPSQTSPDLVSTTRARRHSSRRSRPGTRTKDGAKFELDCWNCGLTGHLIEIVRNRIIPNRQAERGAAAGADTSLAEAAGATAENIPRVLVVDLVITARRKSLTENLNPF